MEIHTSDLDEAFDGIRQEVLRWMKNRAGRELPPEAWRGDSFELADVGSQRTEATFLEDAGYWAARLDAADKSIAERSWVTETAIAKRDGAIKFGVRVTCVARRENPKYLPTIPGFVKQVVDNFGGVVDGRPIGRAPWLIDTLEEASRLLDLMRSPDRRQDVVAITTSENSENPGTALFPAESVFERTIGAAHVVVVTATGAYALTDLVGKELSVFRQAVRTYRPGFDPDGARPQEHPLALGTRISDWPGGPSDFADFLVASCLHGTVDRQDWRRQLPPYVEVKEAAQKLRKQAEDETVKSEQELIALYQAEIDGLNREKQEYQDLLETADNESRQLRTERDVARKENWRLKSRIAHLEGREAHGPRVEDEIPDNFDDLQRWSTRHLAGSVKLDSRAIRAAKNSPFEDVPLAYRALLILRDHYVPMRREGGNELREAYQEALAREGIREQPTFSGDRAGEHGDSYFIMHKGRKRKLDRHLKGSSARDSRYGFRLYFFWDDEDEEVIVGWLPEHLPTRIS